MRAGIMIGAVMIGLVGAASLALAGQEFQDLDEILEPGPEMAGAPSAPLGEIPGSEIAATRAYEFDECVRPEEPVLANDPSSQGRITRAARNSAVRQYNAHVEASNAYMRCIAEEAERDLNAYYAAVSAALDAEQADVIGDLEALRERLRSAR